MKNIKCTVFRDKISVWGGVWKGESASIGGLTGNWQEPFALF